MATVCRPTEFCLLLSQSHEATLTPRHSSNMGRKPRVAENTKDFSRNRLFAGLSALRAGFVVASFQEWPDVEVTGRLVFVIGSLQRPPQPN